MVFNSPFEALKFQSFSRQQFHCPSASHTEAEPCPTGSISQVDSLRRADGIPLTTRARIGLAHFGPKFKITPVKKWSRLSWQQTFYIPIQKQVDGQWISFSQFFYDRSVGSRFQLFAEVNLWTTVAPQFKVFPAAKIFYSYFPNNWWTIYAMASVPAEYGLGTKLQIQPQLELELLYTHYLPVEFLVGEARPRTFNLGIRDRR